MKPFARLPSVGERIDRFEIIGEVATGGMAAVFAVCEHQRRTQKILALKMPLPHLATDERFTKMFLDEARIAARIEHPNVVQTYEVGAHQGSPYLVMEFLRGRSLSELIARAGGPKALSLETRLEVLRGIAAGLGAAHRARTLDGAPLNIVHRDVSPSNVHLGFDGAVKLVDFGIAAARGRLSTTRTGETKGKLAFLSPEQLQRGSEVDARSDIWSFGVLAWELMAGRRLFLGESDSETIFNVLNREIDDVQQFEPALPDAIADRLMQCVSRERERRPQHIDEVLQTLGTSKRLAVAEVMTHFFGAESVEQDAALARAFSTVRRPERSRAVGALAVIVLGSLGGGAWWVVRHTNDPTPEPRAAVAPGSELPQNGNEPVRVPGPELVPSSVQPGKVNDPVQVPRAEVLPTNDSLEKVKAPPLVPRAEAKRPSSRQKRASDASAPVKVKPEESPATPAKPSAPSELMTVPLP